ncbi:MAG: hypothetical protein JST98_03725 [Bacteroidetes bacterium]|nr:hypothetical protein [Bacteroidota bacterium]
MRPLAHQALFVAALALAAPAAAQSKTAKATPAKAGGTAVQYPALDPSQVSLGADYMVQELHATEAQAQQLRAIEEDINNRIRANANDAPAEREAKERMLVAERNRREAAVLTKEQQAKKEQLQRDALKDQEAKYELGRQLQGK